MQDVDALKRAGRHEEAAELLLARGAVREAAELFSTVWKYERAVEVTLAAGLLVEAYRHAVQSKDKALIEPVLAQVCLDAAMAGEAALIALSRNRIRDAAALLSAAGEHAEAARRYEEAGDLRAAGELAERAGDLKTAGRFYERHLKDHEEDTSVRLALGRILVRFGRTEHAVKHLQALMGDATVPPQARATAGRLLVAAFDQLGLADAASATLDELRRTDAALPNTVRALIAQHAPEREHEAAPLVAGRYRILRTIGAGGTGRVLLAEDSFFAREVALKVLSSVEGAKGRDALVRFAREARLSGSLEHPNVVRVIDYLPDGPYLVMEWMSGGTLDDRLYDGPQARADGVLRPLAPEVARHVLTSVLRALDAAHRRGVVHRDVKPANVFFGPAGEVKLGDFGAAHLLDVGATRTGALMGTLAYMAPEQIASASRIHPATDLYAMAVLAYAALAGALPFPGPDFVEQHLSQPPPPFSELAPPWLTIDAAALTSLEELLGAMLDKSPDERPESALAVLAVLDRLPWDAFERAYQTRGEPTARSERTSKPPSVAPPPAQVASRYVVSGPASPSGVLSAKDELLNRPVELVQVEGPVRERLLALAKVFSPHLQAVYGLTSTDAAAMVVLEAIEPSAGKPDLLAVRSAAFALQAVGLAHGALLESLGKSGARTVVRLPLAPDPGDAKARDDAALEQIAQESQR